MGGGDFRGEKLRKAMPSGGGGRASVQTGLRLEAALLDGAVGCGSGAAARQPGSAASCLGLGNTASFLIFGACSLTFGAGSPTVSASSLRLGASPPPGIRRWRRRRSACFTLRALTHGPREAGGGLAPRSPGAQREAGGSLLAPRLQDQTSDVPAGRRRRGRCGRWGEAGPRGKGPGRGPCHAALARPPRTGPALRLPAARPHRRQ